MANNDSRDPRNFQNQQTLAQQQGTAAVAQQQAPWAAMQDLRAQQQSAGVQQAQAQGGPHVLVRIKPSNNRESHSAFGVTIRKADGWCKVPLAVAQGLYEERMNEANPEASPRVFDVMDESEARSTAQAESVRYEPAGTVDRPKDKTGGRGDLSSHDLSRTAAGQVPSIAAQAIHGASTGGLTSDSYGHNVQQPGIPAGRDNLQVDAAGQLGAINEQGQFVPDGQAIPPNQGIPGQAAKIQESDKDAIANQTPARETVDPEVARDERKNKKK